MANIDRKSTPYKYDMGLLNEPGEFRMVDTSELYIDHSYQRPIAETKLKSLVSSWSWLACGCLTVANRDGILYVVDGQHRLAAARRCNGVTHMPCLIFKTAESSEEAKGFLTAQCNRKPVSAIEKFNAMVVIGDSAALLVQRLVAEDGRTVGSSSCRTGHNFQPVGCMIRHAVTDPKQLQKIWPVICEVCKNVSMTAQIINGLMYIESALSKQGESITDARWRKRIVSVGYEALSIAATRGCNFYGNGSPKSYALGICQALNKGLRNKLVIPDSETMPSE